MIINSEIEKSIEMIKSINSKINNLKSGLTKLEKNVDNNLQIDYKKYDDEKYREVTTELDNISKSLVNDIIPKIRRLNNN